MTAGMKAVIRLLDGAVIKGYLDGFTEKSTAVEVRPLDGGPVQRLGIEGLKAIFFVRSFEGDRSYHEKKSYGIRKPRGNRIFIKFTDGEDMVGFLEGKVPWDRGFFLSPQKRRTLTGFYLLPADEGSNNVRVFVFTAAVRDVTVVP